MSRTIEQVQAEMDAYEGLKTKKEYRNLKAELEALKANDIGLGDLVEKVTEVTGIKKLVETVTDALGIDCGCEERKESWNNITIDSIKSFFRNKKDIQPISDEDYAFLCRLFKNGVPNTISREEQKVIRIVYQNAFGIRKQATSCAPCLRATVSELHNLYKLNTKQDI
jgi:hypothetical protein